MYPKAWDVQELVLAKAFETGRVRIPSLKNKLHKIFRPERWQVNRDEYEALLPSMRLASHLIEVGIPYLSNFLPSDQLYQVLTSKVRSDAGDSAGYTVPLQTDNVSQEDVGETRAELNTISESVSWQVNYEMYRTLSWQGITRTVFDTPRPWAEITLEETKKSDDRLKKLGYTRRRLTIGIMGEYVMALRQFPPDSEAYLRATFLAAITMTHEVGHAVFHQDFRSLDYDPVQGYEPWVGQDCWAELGLSYIGWIFSGYNPAPCTLGSVSCPWNNHTPLAWFKQFTIDEQPLYETTYSIGTQYLEELQSGKFWDSLGNPEDDEFSKAARRRLRPKLDASKPQSATAMLPQWKWSRHEGPLWKIRFNDRRATTRPIVTPEEIQWEQAQLKIRYPHPRSIRWNCYPSPRVGPLEAPNEVKDRHVCFRPTGKPNTESSLHSLCAPEIPRREMDDGFISPDLPEIYDKKTNILLTVRHRPEIILTRPPRGNSKRFMDDPNDPEKGERFNNEGYDPNDIAAVLNNKVGYKIGRMTHEQAFKYCGTRNITFGPDYKDDETWQKSRLHWWNLPLVQRIKDYSFRRLEKRFKDSPGKLFQIKQFACRNGEWSAETLMEFCMPHELCNKRSQGVLYKRPRNWLETDLEAARHMLPEQEAENSTQASTLLRHTSNGDLGVQSEAHVMNPFGDNMLPSWGKRNTWIQRVYRFKEEREKGGDVSRWAINQDTLGVVKRTYNGVETYRFEANLHRTTVAVLKTELLVIGMFPSDSCLGLYFGAARHNVLEDDKPLSFYEGQSFSDMWLEVRKVDHEVEISTPDLGCELALTYQPRDPKRSMHSIKDKSQAFTPNPSLKRTLDIMEGNAVPTITERMEQVVKLVSQLMQATEANEGRDILHPHCKGRKSTSGAEMLDNLDDLEELEEERRQNLKRVLRFGHGYQVPREDEDEGITKEHEGSFMADRYQRIDSNCS